MCARSDPNRSPARAGSVGGRWGPSPLIGWPLTPPERAMTGLRWIRRLLRSGHRRTAFPPMAIVEATYATFDNRVLGLLVQLGIPDRLDRPRTAVDLASASGADAEGLERVLRYAVSRGYVRRRNGGRYAASSVSELLRTDHPNSWAPWVRRANSPWFWDALTGLDETLGVTPEVPVPNDSMTADSMGSAIQALALRHGLSWDGTAVVCDVGGGRGMVLEVLLDAMPHLHGILFDQAAMTSDARPALVSGPLAARCRIESGDFLADVPRGADRYLLMAIMTLFDDAGAVAVLSAVGAAMTSSARLFVVDSELADRPREDIAQSTDLLLLAMRVGRERTRRQYRALFAEAGLELRRAHRLVSGSTAFELARSS